MKRFIAALAFLALLSGCDQLANVKIEHNLEVKAEPTWTMEGGDPARTSMAKASPKVRFDAGAIAINLLRPDTESKSGETASPLVIGNSVVFGTAKRVVGAADYRTGEFFWTHNLRGRMHASPAYSGGLVFVADDLGWIEALDMSGKKIWEFRMPGSVLVSLVVSGKSLFALTSKQNLYCFDTATGKPLWRYESQLQREGTIWRASSPAVADGKIYLGLSEGEIVALDAEFGRLLWKKTITAKTTLPDITVGPVLDGGVLYAGAIDGPLVAMKADTGELIWKKDFRGVGGIAVGPKFIYFGTVGGKFVCLRKSDGDEYWTIKLDHGAPSAPVFTGTRIYVGASLGSFYELDAVDGEVLQQVASGSGVEARPYVGEEGLAFLSNFGVLQFFEARP